MRAEDDAGFMVTELAAMPAQGIVDKKALASMLKCDPRTINNMIVRRELPPPVTMCGRSVWTAGGILRYLESRLERVLEETERHAKRIG